MNGKPMCILLFCSALAQASGPLPRFEGAPRFAAGVAGVAHTLVISRWQVDRKGVPSFDYKYEQRAGGCRFQISGHAVGVFDIVKGKVELVVFNPEDETGAERPAIVVFEDGAATLTLRADGSLREVRLSSPVPQLQRERVCAKGDQDGLSITLHR